MIFSILKRKHNSVLNNRLEFQLINRSSILSLLITLSAFFQVQGQSWQVIRTDHFAGLGSASGEVIIPSVYDNIGWSNQSEQVYGDVIGYMEDGKWGLISLKNKKLTPPQFEIFVPHTPGRIKAAIKGKFSNRLFYGLLDDKGKVIVDFNYFSIESFSDQLLKVSDYRNRKAYYGLLRNNGEQILDCNFNDIAAENGFLIASNGDKKRLFSEQGSPYFDFWLDEVSFRDFGCLVSKNGKYGLVGYDGQVKYSVEYKLIDEHKVIPFNHWQILDQENGTNEYVLCDSLILTENNSLVAYSNDYSQYLNPKINELSSHHSDQLVRQWNDLLIYQNQNTLTWSVFMDSGESLLKDFDLIELDEAYVYALNNDRWSIYDKNGDKVNDRSVGKIAGVHGAYLAVRNNGYWGWMNQDGEITVRYKYDQVKAGVLEDQFIAKYVKSWGVADFKDAFIIAPEYDAIEVVSHYYVASIGRAKHLYNSIGELVNITTGEVSGDRLLLIHEYGLAGALLPSGIFIESKYDSIWATADYYQMRSGDFVKLINQDGEAILDFEDEIQEVVALTEGFFLIKKENRFGFVDIDGKLRIANRYDSAKVFSEQMAAVQLIGKWGFINKDEELKIQPFYDFAGQFIDGLAIVRIEKNWSIVNKKGSEIIELKWKEVIRQSTGNFVVTDFDGIKGLVNRNGEMILAPVFDDLIDVDERRVIATRYGRKGVLGYDGFTVIPFEYDDIQVKGDYVLLLENKITD